MGYLKDTGITFNYEESKQYQDKIKKDGIIQFLNLTKKYINYTSMNLQKQIDQRPFNPNIKVVYWGDEIESHVVKINDQNQTVQIQPNLQYVFKHFKDHNDEYEFEVHPEYGAWMIETTPKMAYHTICNFWSIVNNIRERKRQIQKVLNENEYILQIPNFFMLGHPDQDFFVPLVKQEYGQSSPQSAKKVKRLSKYLSNKIIAQQVQSDVNSTLNKTDSLGKKNIKKQISEENKEAENQETELSDEDNQTDDNSFQNQKTKSLFIDERLINPHPRFPTLAENIRTRRGEKVKILVPLFKDKNTKFEASESEPYPGFIYMDAMGFGMGQCCLQTTFSVIDFDHSRFVYDQLAILAPIFLALTAGTPIFKGQLADIDTRWQIIEDSVDCRNADERDPNNPKFIPKSRYSSISYFISNNKRNKECYNNIKFPLNQEIMDFTKVESKKRNLDIDDQTLKHIGFLYQRDAMVIYKDRLELDNEKDTAHFENIQSTNWNSVRLKPPPSFDSNIGWRVEFRVMELQLTDDDNAAFAIFSHMFVRMLYEEKWFGINFYIPMDKVDENFKRAARPNAILTEKFYFRTNIFDEGEPIIEEMSLDEIFFGCPHFKFEGLYKACNEFVSKWNQITNLTQLSQPNQCDQATGVWQFIKNRTSGKIKTLATWIREFVQSHPNYKQDSRIDNKIAYDLTKKMIDISYYNIEDPNFPIYFKKNNNISQIQKEKSK